MTIQKSWSQESENNESRNNQFENLTFVAIEASSKIVKILKSILFDFLYQDFGSLIHLERSLNLETSIFGFLVSIWFFNTRKSRYNGFIIVTIF